MAVGGAVFALTNAVPALILAGLTGTLSVDVIESGPFTSVEQAMIPEVAGARATRAFGRYNAIAALAGREGPCWREGRRRSATSSPLCRRINAGCSHTPWSGCPASYWSGGSPRRA